VKSPASSRRAARCGASPFLLPKQLRDAVPEMKKFKGSDRLFGDVTIRQDGRVIHPMYLFEVKKPEESKYPYDYYRLVSTIPAEQAFRPMADGGCPMIK